MARPALRGPVRPPRCPHRLSLGCAHVLVHKHNLKRSHCWPGGGRRALCVPGFLTEWGGGGGWMGLGQVLSPRCKVPVKLEVLYRRSHGSGGPPAMASALSLWGCRVDTVPQGPLAPHRHPQSPSTHSPPRHPQSPSGTLSPPRHPQSPQAPQVPWHLQPRKTPLVLHRLPQPPGTCIPLAPQRWVSVCLYPGCPFREQRVH